MPGVAQRSAHVTRGGLAAAALCALALLSWSGAPHAAQRASAASGRAAGRAAPPRTLPEMRGMWVDAYHPGLRTPAEIAQLVADAKRARLNTLFVQVRRRADAMFARAVEPAMDDPAYDPSFDALAAVVAAAHREGLRVHAWMNAMPVWEDVPPPRDPRHVFNQHGPASRDAWLTTTPDGVSRFPVGYFLDPGHPAVQEHLAQVYLSVVRNYDVDGIHFDYVRYPETEDGLARGSRVGYHPVSLARFQRATGRSDVPAPDDEAWSAWRREQVTAIVRRVSLEARTIKPSIVVSAAVIAWGAPPVGEDDFVGTAAMQLVFQDWHAWLADGWIDLAVPMNYAPEADEVVRTWFDGWIAWEKRHQHGRHVAVGLGAYRNSPAETLAQVRRVREPADTARVSGMSFFSYAVPTSATPPAGSPNAAATTHSTPFAFLADGAPGLAPAFAAPAPVPQMPWLARPTRGWLRGVVRRSTPAEADGVDVDVVSLAHGGSPRRVRTDANGVFGLGGLTPGRYRVAVAANRSAARPMVVTVTAGVVAGVVLR